MVYTQLNDKIVLFQAIQFNINAQLSSIWPIDRKPIRCYHSGPEWTWEWWQWRGTLHSPKPQHYWNLTIRLFRVIFRILIGVCGEEVLPFCREAVGVFYSSSQLGKHFIVPRYLEHNKRFQKYCPIFSDSFVSFFSLSTNTPSFLHTGIWYQVFLFNTNDFHLVLWF